MMGLFTEIRKTKRTGVVPIMPLVGVLGSCFAFMFLMLQKNTLLSLGISPTEILLTKVNSLVVTLNMFGIIIITSIIYNMEFTGNAVKKMHMLPVTMGGIYLRKFIICVFMFLVCLAIQYCTLFFMGGYFFHEEVFALKDFVSFGTYSFITSLPVLCFMLFISSINQRIWLVIGIGVLGFLSAMAMAMGQNPLFLANPFVLMLKPAIDSVLSPSSTYLVFAGVESLIFILGGFYVAEKSFYQ